MKSCQFFKIYKRAYKKREKTVIERINEKRKTDKSCTLFYLTDYFIKPLKMSIKHFFFNRSFYSQDFFFVSQIRSQGNFCFLMSR